MWCGVIMTRRAADRQSVCYYVTSLHQPLSVSSVFVQVTLLWHYHYYYHYEYYALCSPNLYYVIPDLIMPNCSWIRLSTLQPQHQTYRHSSNNQTLATFTFNILTFKYIYNLHIQAILSLPSLASSASTSRRYTNQVLLQPLPHLPNQSLCPC